MGDVYAVQGVCATLLNSQIWTSIVSLDTQLCFLPHVVTCGQIR
jgi:hypothetical protein